MKQNGFSVHKYIIENNRASLYLWALENEQLDIYNSIFKEWVDLDDFHNDRVPLNIISQEYNNIALLFNEPNLGLKVVQKYDSQRSPFFHALKLSLEPILFKDIELPKSLVLRMACHYYSIITEVASMDYNEFNHNIVISFQPNLPNLISKHQIEGIMFGFARLVNNFINKWPERIQFTHQQEIVNTELYLSTFNRIPTFSHERNQLTYDIPISNYDNDYPLLIKPIIHNLKHQFPETTFNEMIKIILQVTLGFIHPTRKNIANSLSMTVRTLQRRLSDEGVNFNDLLLDVRKTRVNHYLSYRHLTLEKISLLLGYKAKSQFLNAFKSWFGMTPKEYRAKM